MSILSLKQCPCYTLQHVDTFIKFSRHEAAKLQITTITLKYTYAATRGPWLTPLLCWTIATANRRLASIRYAWSTSHQRRNLCERCH